MRLLDRYLFRELFAPLTYCLAGIMILGVSITLFNQLDDLQDHKLHLLDIIEYSIAITPQFFVTALPVVLLLALLIAMTEHSRANEITAMRAAGVSLWRVCAPYFAMGVAASLLFFVMNEFLAPRSADWAKNILTRYVQKPGDLPTQKTFQGFVSGQRQWQFSEYHESKFEMISPVVIWKLPNGGQRQIHAASAIYTNGVWVFVGAKEQEQISESAPLLPVIITNQLAMPEFNETPSLIRSEIKVSGWLASGIVQKADLPLFEMINYLNLHPKLPQSSMSKFLTEFHGRIAETWTCLIVVFVAIPFGVASGRRNLFAGVAGSIGLCFVYFIVQKFSLGLGSVGSLPAWLAAWLPNLIFGGIGFILMTRVR